jgi:exoribonuclease R
MAPLNIDLSSLKPFTRSMRLTSTSTSQSTSLPNAFNRIMGGVKETSDLRVIRDTCLRLMPEYNSNYNPYVIPREDLRQGYSPYVFKEPLFDDRLTIVA